jgi:hypothetical protein
MEESKKRASRSRARLQYGGELVAAEAHELRARKAELLGQKLEAKEARKQRQARNRARKQLHRAGIEARKEERLRKKAVAQFRKEGLLIPPEFEEPIRDPEAPEIESESEYESCESMSEGGSGNEEVIISEGGIFR